MSDSEATDITYPKLPLESEISKKNKGKKKAKAKGTKDSQAEESNELGASKSDKKKNRPSVESVHNSESEASGRDDKGKEPAVDDESDVPDVETATKFTKKQRKAVTHVIRAGAKNYYGILKLDRTCSDSEIRNAYKRWALKTHPDQNKFKDASEAFKLVSEAYQVLIKPRERQMFDLLQEQYEASGLINPTDIYDEEFHANASGDETSESEPEADELPIPDADILNVYTRATTAVNAYLFEQSEGTRIMIEEYNQEIRQVNREAGRSETLFLIQISILDVSLNYVKSCLRKIEQNPKDKGALRDLSNQIDVFASIKKTFYYPETWQLDIPPKVEKKLQKSRQSIPTSEKVGESSNSRKKGRTSSKAKNTGPASTKDKDNMDWEATSQNGTNISHAKTHHDWKPGETKKGEKILGHRPFMKTDLETGQAKLQGVHFIVEKKGEPNPIAMISGEEAGRRVTRAYLRLPKSQQNDIRYSDRNWDMSDIDKFGKVIGFASRPFKNKSFSSNKVYPDGYALVEMKDGKEALMNRQAVRNIIGKKDADDEIAEFHEEIGETPSWELKPLAWRDRKPRLLTGSSRGHHRKSHWNRRYLTSRDDASDYDSEVSSDSDAGSDSDSSSSYRRTKTVRNARRARREGRKRGEYKTSLSATERVAIDNLAKVFKSMMEG